MQEMVTRTPAVPEGHLQPSGIPGHARAAGWSTSGTGKGYRLLTGWQAEHHFPGEGAAGCSNPSAHIKAVCQQQVTVWLMSVLQEFSTAALAPFFSVAEASRASVSIPVACFHKTWWRLMIFDVCPLSFQNILISVTRFRNLGRQVPPDIPIV